MSLGLATFLLQMPSTRQLLNLMAEDLRYGRSLVALLSDGIEPYLLRPALFGELEPLHLHIHEVYIPDLDADAPAAALAVALGITWRSSTMPRTVENLLKHTNLPEVLILDGFDELNTNDRIQWLHFIVQWAQVCQGKHFGGHVGSETPPALCLIAKASKIPHPPPRTNVLLTMRIWWGIPTTLEMQMLCQLAAEEDSSPLNRWKEYTIPAIVGSDLQLADYLWVAEYHNSLQLAEELRRYAQKRGWDKTGMQDWPTHALPQDTKSWLDGWPFSRSLYNAWAEGTVHWTPEYGLERHSGVLALLNQQEALDHRLWRGQARFLLSEIDKIRLAMCAHLNRCYGHDWPYKWKEPETDLELKNVIVTPFACQWGHLKYLLRNRQELNKERRWVSLVNRSWYIRSQLAHYRPITLNDYDAFCRELHLGRQAGLMTV